MFEKARQQNTQQKTLLAVKTEVRQMVKNGGFLYTPILLMDDPWRTFALYAIDDISIDGDKLTPKGNPLVLPDVRLINIDPINYLAKGAPRELRKQAMWPGQIRYKQREPREIPGTMGTQNEEVDVWIDAGQDATLPHRIARQLLHLHGFPIVGRLTKGAQKGRIVEYEWIRRESKLENCHPEVREVWKQIQERLEPQAPLTGGSKAPKEARP